ncbi:MAG: YceI family protein [Bacteroidota bacterium]
MKNTMLLTALLSLSLFAAAQDRYMTRSGKIYFLSDAPMEKIEAVNNQAASVLDASTGKVEFSVLMKSFEFEKALMGEHFQEKYVESDKFPKSSFKGIITDFSSVNLSKDGTYPVKYKGDFSLHGVTKPVDGSGSVTVKAGKISAKSTFMLPIEAYGIEIPSLVKDKIAKEVKVMVDASYEKFEKK